MLDMGDENVDDISEDFSLNEDSLLMPDETQKDQQPVKLSLSEGHPLKTIKSSKSIQMSRKSAVSSSESTSSKDTSKNITSTRKEYATRLSGDGVLETTADTAIPAATKRSAQSLIQGNLLKNILHFVHLQFYENANVFVDCNIFFCHRPSETK